MSRHALLLLDSERLRCEHAQISRLVVALTADGWRMHVALPEKPFGDDHPADRPIGLEEPIRFPQRTAPWLREDRLRAIAERFERTTPDLIWAAGREVWPLGTSLAQRLERPLLVHLDGLAEARGLKRFAKHAPVAGVIAPSTQLVELVQTTVPQAYCQLVAPGIAIAQRDQRLREHAEDGPLAITILGPGSPASDYRAMLGALSALRDTGAGFRCALEIPRRSDTKLWRLLRRYDLAELTTCLGEVARLRRLVSATDLLLRPAPENRARPAVLEAMAEGAVVVSVAEPWLDTFNSDNGVGIVEEPTQAAWIAQLEPLLLDGNHRREMGERARATIISSHRSSDRAEAVRLLFDRIVGEDSLQLKSPSGARKGR